jgi:hypothetical protein
VRPLALAGNRVGPPLTGHYAPVRMWTIQSLDELAELLERSRDKEELFVRWSRGPDVDMDCNGGGPVSRDALTGVLMPGLSANALSVEPWWGDRSVRLWVARRLYDYRHLRDLRGPGVRPWVLAGEECGRGPDNEPLVRLRRPIAWVSEDALRQCEHALDAQQSPEWGPLHRAD